MSNSTFRCDGYNDGYNQLPWSGPCFSVHAQEYTEGYEAGKQDRDEADRLEYRLERDLL